MRASCHSNTHASHRTKPVMKVETEDLEKTSIITKEGSSLKLIILKIAVLEQSSDIWGCCQVLVGGFLERQKTPLVYHILIFSIQHHNA